MLKTIQSPVSEDLDRFNLLMRESLSCGNLYIDTITDYVLSNRGKQMRPLLVLLTAALNGGISERSFTGAMLVELTHIASLVHDDVVDEACMRRGQLSVNAIWRSKTAVLTGDFILSRALNTAVKSGATDLLEIIVDSFESLCEGELLQMEHSPKLDMTEDLYFRIIDKKTASLLGACGSIGAKSAGAPAEAVEKMYDLGRYLGLAFQIKDDMLDYTAGAKTGKPACIDLRERKITLPLLYLLENSNASRRKELMRKISRAADNEACIEEIRKAVVENGGMEYSRQKMLGFRDKALEILSAYTDSEVKKSLELYCDFILERDK